MLPDWPTKTEDGSDYDGPLSTHPEWHALSHGVYKGITTKPWQTPPEPDNEDVEAESHYYRGGYVIGTLVQVAILVGFGEAAFDVTTII